MTTRADRERVGLAVWGEYPGCAERRWINDGDAEALLLDCGHYGKAEIAIAVDALIAPLMAEIKMLRDELREYAIVHLNGGSGWDCQLCGCDWPANAPEVHHDDCAAKEPSE